MRSTLVSLVALLCLGLTTPAQAERRMFIVANDADGYGIDRCLASGDKCGAAAASAYCKTQAFAGAATFHKVERDQITGAIPTGGAGGCDDNKCGVVAIVCTR
jgi:hypothetical protein